MNEKHVDDALARLLREGDPAPRTPGLEAAESSAMRRRVLAAHRERRARPNGWLVPATAAMALLALALGLALRQPKATSPAADLGRPRPTMSGGATGQQIQFTTEGGTLVVWVLQPRATG